MDSDRGHLHCPWGQGHPPCDGCGDHCWLFPIVAAERGWTQERIAEVIRHG